MVKEQAQSWNSKELQISVEVLPGRGDAAFTANVQLDGFLTIYDCIIFKDKSGELQLHLPTKMVNGERWPIVEIEAKWRERVVGAIRAACR